MPSEDQVMPCDDDAPYCEPEVKMARSNASTKDVVQNLLDISVTVKEVATGLLEDEETNRSQPTIGTTTIFVMGYCKEPAFVLQLLLKWWIGQIT